MIRPPLPVQLLERLQRGLAIGAAAHIGLSSTWQWVVGYLSRAVNYFVTTANGATGDVTILAGSGIDVETNGNVIKISTGTGKNTNYNRSTYMRYGTYTTSLPSNAESAKKLNATYDPYNDDGVNVTVDGDGVLVFEQSDDTKGCNTVTDAKPKNDNSEIPVNEGDNCEEINN